VPLREEKRGHIQYAPTGSNKNIENVKYKKCRGVWHMPKEIFQITG